MLFFREVSVIFGDFDRVIDRQRAHCDGQRVSTSLPLCAMLETVGGREGRVPDAMSGIKFDKGGK